MGEIGNGTIICRDSVREELIESDRITEEIVSKAQEAGAEAFRRYRRPEMVLTVLIAPYQMWWEGCGAIEDAYETEDGVGISPGQRVTLAGNSICVGVLADCFRGLLGRQTPALDKWLR